MNENRCRRCNRKLIDPDAVYGWRCAKKLGVNTHMPSLDWLKQQAIYDTNLVMDIIIVSGYELNYLEAMDLYESVYKWSLAKETDDQLLMDMAYDDSISVEQFMKMYNLKYTFATDDADIFIFNPSSTRYNYEYFRPNGIDREDIDELADYLAKKYSWDTSKFADNAEIGFKGGWIYYPENKIVIRANNAFEDFERVILQQPYDDELFWTLAGMGNTILSGTLKSYKAIEKKKGNLSGKEVKQLVEEFGKVNKKPLKRNILKYAGHLSTAYDVAYISVTAYGDYQEDGEFGEETAKAIAGTVASGVAMAGAATAAATLALPMAGAAAVTIISGYAMNLLAEKGVEYLYSKKGKDEIEEISQKIMQSFINNPEALNELIAQLAQEDAGIAYLAQCEAELADEEVGELILGTKTDTKYPWVITTTEYGLG